MARQFMFAALCQRAHPLKHSLAEYIFVSRVKKQLKIFVSRKIRQQGHSLAEVSLYFFALIDRIVYCADVLLLVSTILPSRDSRLLKFQTIIFWSLLFLWQRSAHARNLLLYPAIKNLYEMFFTSQQECTSCQISVDIRYSQLVPYLDAVCSVLRLNISYEMLRRGPFNMGV